MKIIINALFIIICGALGYCYGLLMITIFDIISFFTAFPIICMILSIGFAVMTLVEDEINRREQIKKRKANRRKTGV